MRQDPDSQHFFAPTPTRVTRFLRTFFPWQALKFLWINWKMVRMIRLSHGGTARTSPPAAGRAG